MRRTSGQAIGAFLDAQVYDRFTAAVVRVERAGTVVYESAFGSVDAEPQARATERTTRFDLASLTKVLVATAALRAVENGTLALDESLATIEPKWRDAPYRAITLRLLLAHTSGMHSGADYRTLLGENVVEFALARELDDEPGRRVIYSDLGFIALGRVLERATGQTLAAVVADACAALGMHDTAYRPRGREAGDIPATEDDAWRGRVRGFVHDEKAYLMGGVAGHAGLFGSAFDVARIAQPYLDAARGRPNAALGKALANAAIEEQGSDPVLRRGLGWALKTSDENSCGRAMSFATFGHTGFTGTSLWADPQRDLCVVLLTNAVYYGRGDLRDVRAAVCDAAVEAFG